MGIYQGDRTMSLVNSSLLNMGGMASNPASETLPAGESGDLNHEFAQMLQYLRQGTGTKEQNESKEDASKASLLQEGSQEPEVPMKNLLGFLDAVEGQMAKDSGSKSNEANAALGIAPLADKLSALAQFLKTLEAKLTAVAGVEAGKAVGQADTALGARDLEELASLLEDVKAFFDQVTDASQLPISSGQVKNLSLMSAGNEPSTEGLDTIATDTFGSAGDDQSALLVIPEIKVDVDQEIKSQSMIAKGLSSALLQLQALVSKVKSASNSNDRENLVSAPDASKLANLLESIKGIDLNKLFTNSDKPAATVDSALDGTHQPTIDEFMTILKKVKSERISSASIVSEGNISDGPAPLALPMRTSDVVFPSDSGKTSAAIENMPEALSETLGVLQKLKGTKTVADELGDVVDAGDTQKLFKTKAVASSAIGGIEAVKLKVSVDAKPVTKIKSEAELITAIKSDQAAVAGTETSPVEVPSQTMGSVSVAKAAEFSELSFPQKAPLEQGVQYVEELPAASVRLNPETTSKSTTTEALDVAAKTVSVVTPGKVENTETPQASLKTAELPDVIQAAKVATPAQQKDMMQEVEIKDSNNTTEPKVEKAMTLDLKEVKSEATVKRPDGADISPKAESGKVEAKIASAQDKLATGDIHKKASDLERDFAKMAEKAAISKQAEVAEKFKIDPPKIRPRAMVQNTPLDTKLVTDFVGRTAQAFVSQQQGIARKKLTDETSAASSVSSMTSEAASSQQVAASSGSQSQTGQGSSGSNMLEKWADSHLDLSSRGWATNMAKTMVSALNRGQERLMFSLSPPSLGRISIAFTSTRGALDVRIQAERKATIALLGDAEGKLTSNLESAGHRVNSLSYAEMNKGDTKFDFDHNQSSNNENKGKDKSDSSQAEKSTNLEAEAESGVVSNKKADDSLVNITV